MIATEEYTRVGQYRRTAQGREVYDYIVDPETGKDLGMIEYPAGVNRYNTKGAIFTACTIDGQSLGQGFYRECVKMLQERR
jgi:hypothetical protein